MRFGENREVTCYIILARSRGKLVPNWSAPKSKMIPSWGTRATERIKYLPSTLRRWNLKTQHSPVILDLCLKKTCLTCSGNSFEN